MHQLRIIVLGSIGILLVTGFLLQCDNNNPVSHGGQRVGHGWLLQNPYPTPHDLNSVQFLSESEAWAAGDFGTVLHSTDGARSWCDACKFPAAVNDMFFLNTRVGWVVGENGMIMHTDNGGESWTAQNSNTDTYLTAVTFIDSQHGWITGASGSILATRDGGRVWQKQQEGGSSFIRDILFVNGETGWAVGQSSAYENGAELLHTDDGGEHWMHVDAGIPTDLGVPGSYVSACLNSIASPDGESITIVGEANQWDLLGGIRLHSRDRGNSWEVELIREPLFSAYYTTEGLGWIVGYGIYNTVNAGGTWEQQAAPSGWTIRSIDFTNSFTGCAVGSGGTVLLTNNGGSTWDKVNHGSRRPITDIEFSDHLNGWIASYGGVMKTTDGGFTWRETECTSNQALCFLDAADGWATDYTGNLDRTSDGGVTWVRLRENIESRVYDMIFLDSLHGWVSGMPAILGTEDGGYNWTVQWTGSGIRLFGLTFVDRNHGWAVGDNGTILHTGDGGSNWDTQASNTNARLEDVFFADSLQGWAVGSGATILHTADGGRNWGFQAAIYDEPIGILFAVMFASPERGWIAGSDGVILATADGGQSWKVQSQGISADLWALWVLDEELVWAAGWTGGILHTTTGGW